MIRINLLPHREEKRRARRQQFFALLGMVSVLAGLVVFLGFTVIGGYIDSQNDKNEFLKQEIATLNKQIDQIKRLKEQTQALLARKQVIESLQRDRAEATRLLTELARQMPEGVYLRSVKQEGVRVSLGGYAQSNARVSTLMRNFDASPWLEKPQLVEIKAVTVDKRRLNEFTMNVFIRREAQPDAGKPGAKPADAAKDRK
ncbi:PilN domain-containing protein [Rhodocyclus tenuis]|uniref:Type IV pilus assembly protein PilN n=1 Tax=Rhodocyclus tenuis TaxID=1066 RepID=A0A840G1Z5_RHOTE|nr:PilN domain-containing protein [Rhodocyclus tenuis]MBB4245976.1 type IV pilus assembly protein PilN [Rhodocyclus tenuis]